MGIGNVIVKGVSTAISNIDNSLYKNISKSLNIDDSLQSIDTAYPKLKASLDANPHLIDQIKRIDEGVKNPRIFHGLKNELQGVYTGSVDHIKLLDDRVDTIQKTEKFISNFKQFGGIEKGYNSINDFTKEALNSAQAASNNTHFRSISTLSKNIINGSGKENVTQSKLFHDLLLKEPDSIPKHFNGVTQDDIFKALDGDIPDSIASNKVLSNAVKAYQDYDKSIINNLQNAGVNIGNLKEFTLPFNIPRDAYYNLGKDKLTALFNQYTTLSETKATNIVFNLRSLADDTGTSTGFKFGKRDLEFRSRQHELDFYRILNNVDKSSSLHQLYVNHKGRLLKKGTLISQFGIDPIATYNSSINNIIEGAGSEGVAKAKRLQDNFRNLVDSLNGKINVTNSTVEQLRVAISNLTSIATGASSLSFVRNLFIDFNANAASVSSAIYNPKYSVGNAAFGILKDLGYVFQRLSRTNNKTKKAVDDLVNIMEFAQNTDANHNFGLVTLENLFDVDGVSKKPSVLDKFVEVLSNTNNNLQSVSGQHSFTDFRRFRHLITFQQMWTKTLDNFSYKEWFDSADNLGKKQLKYLETVIGLGEKEFNFLREATKIDFDNNGKNLSLLSRSSILSTDVSKAAKYAKEGETAEKFITRVANSWQQLIYNTTQQATPIPQLANSPSAQLNNVGSWTRLMLSPFYKFGDVAQSQWNNVVNRVSLATYGNANQKIGLDGSLAGYSKVAALYTGGAVGAVWLKDVLSGRELTDFRFSNTKGAANVGKVFTNSGMFGFPAMIASSFLNLYPTSQGGLYSTSPLASLFRNGDKIVKAMKNNKGSMQWYRISEEVRKLTGYGNIWYLRGLVSKSLRSGLLSKSEEKRVLKQREGGRRGKN